MFAGFLVLVDCGILLSYRPCLLLRRENRGNCFIWVVMVFLRGHR